MYIVNPSCFLAFITWNIREFDENLLRRISNIFYEDEVVNLPCAPDVSNFLISEVQWSDYFFLICCLNSLSIWFILLCQDASFIPNGIANAPIAEGLHGPEVAQRLHSLVLSCFSLLFPIHVRCSFFLLWLLEKYFCLCWNLSLSS